MRVQTFTLYCLPAGEIFLVSASVCDYSSLKVAVERTEYNCKLGGVQGIHESASVVVKMVPSVLFFPQRDFLESFHLVCETPGLGTLDLVIQRQCSCLLQPCDGRKTQPPSQGTDSLAGSRGPWALGDLKGKQREVP